MASKDSVVTTTMRDSARNAWKSPASGFRTDCQKLIERFVATGNVRYEEFSMIWRQMNFSFVFFGRENEEELYEFTEEALAIAKGFWLPPNEFQVRVCGLYLVYGLFTKQPLEPPLKVRLTSSEWKQCRCFVDEALGQHHWDVVFVFGHLHKELDAFHFVFFETEVDPSLRGKELLKDTEGQMKRSATDSVLMDHVNQGAFNVLESIHVRYEAIKRQLLDTDSSLSLRMTDTKAFDVVSGLVSECGAAIGCAEFPDKPEDADLQDGRRNATESSSDDIGASRMRIKARQMALSSQGHRRADLADRDVALDEASD